MAQSPLVIFTSKSQEPIDDLFFFLSFFFFPLSLKKDAYRTAGVRSFLFIDTFLFKVPKALEVKESGTYRCHLSRHASVMLHFGIE